MTDNIAYRGSKLTVEFAKLTNGSIPGLEFLVALEDRWQARLRALFEPLGEFGRITNQEQFRKVRDEFWEFKCFQVRMLCYFRPGGRVVVTHGFTKKRGDTPRSELLRARNIKTQYANKLIETSKEGGRKQ
jgi:phage-related protein